MNEFIVFSLFIVFAHGLAGSLVNKKTQKYKSKSLGGECSMTNDTIQLELNKQVNAELYSSYLYLAIAAYFTDLNLSGFAHWMRIQSQEEIGHAMKFYKYIHERRWQVKLTDIAAPPLLWASPVAAVEAAFAHEQIITYKINRLMDLAVSIKDYASQSLLQWFVNEQIEEENNTDALIQKVKMINADPGMLLVLDIELNKRTASGE
jgi:ferritin